MIAVPKDRFHEFLSVAPKVQCTDPRFDVRQAREEEFEQIYDCVNAAFGTNRSRTAFDWMYRHNPFGKAQVWILVERSSGRMLKTGARYPWPVWRGTTPLHGAVSGDAATVPDWQRKGLSLLRKQVQESHPWSGHMCVFSGPNRNSRALATKQGESQKILGQLTGGVAVLNAQKLLQRAGAPELLAAPVGRLVSSAQTLWRRLTASGSENRHQSFGRVNRFSADLDPLTLRTMSFPGYWCPHGAAFLNWRYLDHPVEQHLAFALEEGSGPVGYSVLRLAGEQATLVEFAVDEQPRERARALLTRTLAVAREAGCAYVNFFGPPAWRHWRLFRRAGMIPYRTNNYLEAVFGEDQAGAQNFRNWQVTPGDRDYH